MLGQGNHAARPCLAAPPAPSSSSSAQGAETAERSLVTDKRDLTAVTQPPGREAGWGGEGEGVGVHSKSVSTAKSSQPYFNVLGSPGSGK